MDDLVGFLGMERGADASRWRLPVQRAICGGRDAVYGGAGLAAAIEAAEAFTGRPLAWAACQFLRPSPLGSVVDLRVEILSEGRAVSHGRVVATVEDREVFATMVSLGERDFPASGVWQTMPEVPPPDACPERYILAANKGGIRERIEERTVTDDPTGIIRSTDGRSQVWVRIRDGLPGSASALALVGDDVSLGVSAVLEPDAQAPSFDNTIRVVSPKATPWILADIEVRAVARGLAHGIVNLWSADGELLGIAGQTGAVRIRGT